MNNLETVVIVGGGLAGAHAAFALREGGFLPEKTGAGSDGGGEAGPRSIPAERIFPAAEPPAAALERSYPLTAGQRQVWAHAQFDDDASTTVGCPSFNALNTAENW